ncbi:MAG: lipoate--protein ligase family protein [Candidatus Omnitrophica bacterium]|nr:lipoate--protein ligase family protein [Candidatus Omnitrophota bacterium]
MDLTLPTPEENLALDEALFEMCENGGGEEFLRFWESNQYFVVLGYSQKAELEVNLDFCRKKSIPILKRSSGGGAVLEGPGCLNYSLILKIPESGPLTSISKTNGHVLSRHKDTLALILKGRAEFAGLSDLALGGRKFSGNAQRRKRNYLLFHGTFLLNFDLNLIENALNMPSKQPEYRKNRSHTEFLTNLNVPAEAVKSRLKSCWNAEEPCLEIPSENIRKLAEDKYRSDNWNFRL